MGQALKTLSPGSEEKKDKEIGPILKQCYKEYIEDVRPPEELTFTDFYQVVCQTIEVINKKFGSSQFRLPKTETLEQVYEKHHKGKGRSLTKEEFEKMVKELMVNTGLTGFGAKDTILYMFGVPVTALFIKQRVVPKAVPNDIFIPVVTSATVFLLAKLNKI